MTAVLVNLLASTFRSSTLPGVLVRYLTFVAGALFLSWPISDLVGRQTPPAVFTVLVFIQAISVPFVVNSFITGRFELKERISVEDWVSYTNISCLATAAAHAIWAMVLGAVMLLAGLPLTLAALPLAGDTWVALGGFALTTLALTAFTSAFGYIILVLMPAEWVTSAAVDACVGMWLLLTLDSAQGFAAAGGRVTGEFLVRYLSPTEAIMSAISPPHGAPWEVVVPLAAAVALVGVGGLAGYAVRAQGRMSINAR